MKEGIYNSNSENERNLFLQQVFCPGTKVVFDRKGERIFEGVISRVEGEAAFINYMHNGQLQEQEVRLGKLINFNSTLIMSARRSISKD